MLSRFFYLLITSLLVMSFFTGCSLKPQAPKKIQAPKWVTNQPSDSLGYTYGIGIGKDRNDALKQALSDVVSKLGVKVESSFTHKQIVDGYYSRSVSTSDIKSNVAEIRVTNYGIEKTKRISYREYAIMLKVENQKFFKTLKSDIEQTKEDIISKIEDANTKDPISRYNIKKGLVEKSDKLLSNVLVAYELNKNFDKNKYFNFVANVKDNYYEEAQSLRFFVYGDNDSQNFVNIVKDQLRTNDFNVVNINNKNIINIKLTSNDNISSKQNILTIKL